jgi:magnesium-transporting ATPase (P-type)
MSVVTRSQPDGARQVAVKGAPEAAPAAPAAAYLGTWFTSADPVRAKTMAFTMRSERDPLIKLGLFSNRVMIGWAVATVLFILAATFVPGIRANRKLTELQAADFALAIGLAFVGTFWGEIRKTLAGLRQKSSAGVAAT